MNAITFNLFTLQQCPIFFLHGPHSRENDIKPFYSKYGKIRLSWELDSLLTTHVTYAIPSQKPWFYIYVRILSDSLPAEKRNLYQRTLVETMVCIFNKYWAWFERKLLWQADPSKQ